jgi:hypothetical protein
LEEKTMGNIQKRSLLFKFIPNLVMMLTLWASAAAASVIPVGPGAFPGTAIPITFSGLADFTEVNGLSVGGVLFNYSLGNGQVQIDQGPGTTNNVNPPNIVSNGDNSGVLTLNLPGFFNTFGYGYAILSVGAVSNATTITLFSGSTNVGSLSYAGMSDPMFTGGFAGIQSTVPFNSVAVTFDSVDAPAFAMDNILMTSMLAPAPEPSTLLLIAGGAAALIARRRSSGVHLKP